MVKWDTSLLLVDFLGFFFGGAGRSQLAAFRGLCSRMSCAYDRYCAWYLRTVVQKALNALRVVRIQAALFWLSFVLKRRSIGSLSLLICSVF